MASKGKAWGHVLPGCPSAADGVLRVAVSPLVLCSLGIELVVFPPRLVTLTRNRVKITMPELSL